MTAQLLAVFQIEQIAYLVLVSPQAIMNYFILFFKLNGVN